MAETLQLAFSLGCVLAVWGGLFLLLTGVGLSLLAAVYGHRERRCLGLVPACWCGYAVTIVALQIWHLFLPVDWRALAALTVLSIAGWGMRRASKPEPGTPLPLPILLAVCGLALWLANRSIGPLDSYDGANYHLTVVRWLNRFAIVPGLANLNPLYGVNSSSLLFSALLEQGPGTARSYHICNGFLLLLLFLLLAPLVGRILTGSSPPAPHQVAASLFIFPAVALISRDHGVWISGHATDVPPAIVVFAASVLALQAFDAYDRDQAQASLGPKLFTALMLFAVAPCLKSTTLIFGATAWLLVLGASWFARRPGTSPLRRPVALAVFFAASAIVPWMARNVVLSGYPFFPASISAFEIDWRVPIEHVKGILWWTSAYARTPDAWNLMAQGGSEWLQYWLNVELRKALFEVITPLALTGAWLLIWIFWRPSRRAKYRFLSLLVPLAMAIPAWFFLAPGPRFGQFLFWCLCALTAAKILTPVLANLPHRPQLLGVALALYAVSPLVLQGYFTIKNRGPDSPPLALRKAFLTPSGPDHGFHPLPRPALTAVAICGGGKVFMPAARNSERNPAPWQATLPWDGPLPSTASLLDGLCLRRPGDLQSGFRIVTDGRSWPERNAREVLAVRERTGWSLGRLAVHFCVRPELIDESLTRASGK